jgi:hypothetical protein
MTDQDASSVCNQLLKGSLRPSGMNLEIGRRGMGHHRFIATFRYGLPGGQDGIDVQSGA